MQSLAPISQNKILWCYCCLQIQNTEVTWIFVYKFCQYMNPSIFLFFFSLLCEGWSEWLPLLMPSWLHRKKLWDRKQRVWEQSLPERGLLQRPGEWIYLPVFPGILRNLLRGEGSTDITAMLVMGWILERNISLALSGSNPRLERHCLS